MEGRAFEPSDRAGARPVAVINAAAAAQYFPGASPIGHRIAVTHSLTESELAEIVGVVADVRYAALDEPAMPALYFSRAQDPLSYGTLFVSGSGNAAAFSDGVRRVAAAMDPNMPLYDVLTMADRKASETARTRVVLWLLAAFAATGLLLAAIGLYGTVSYAVQRRTRELGLRVVLGAARGDVTRLVMKPPVLLAAAGAAIGIIAAAALTRLAGGLLYGIEASDPRVLAAASLVLLTVAGIAAWVPARRATRVEPAAALRSD
jgi:ABC-type antimicrobial peptide transport system permease subunit